MIPRKQIKIRLSKECDIEVQHLSSEGRVVVWMSKPLELTVESAHLIIQGSVRKDGYLGLKVLVDGKMVYPTKRRQNLPHQLGTSIILEDVDLSRVRESFPCGVEHRDAILSVRASVAHKTIDLG